MFSIGNFRSMLGDVSDLEVRSQAAAKPATTATNGIIFMGIVRNDGWVFSGSSHRTAAPPHTDVKDIKIIGSTT